MEEKNSKSSVMNTAIKLAKEHGLEIHIPSLEELPVAGKSNMVTQIYCKSDISQLEAIKKEMGDKKVNKLIDSLKNQFWGKK